MLNAQTKVKDQCDGAEKLSSHLGQCESSYRVVGSCVPKSEPNTRLPLEGATAHRDFVTTDPEENSAFERSRLLYSLMVRP